MMSSISIALLLMPHLILMGDTATNALQLPTDANIQSNRRRDFIIHGSIDAILYHYFYPSPAFAIDGATTLPSSSSLDLFDSKTIYWDGPAWSICRYGTSTLSSSDKSNGNRSNVPPASVPIAYPDWLEGYYAIKYKFITASFPQGRNILSLRTAGAGLGSCLSLPNVGYSPPSSHTLNFIKNNEENSAIVYEDLAYNIPRKLESFWPQTKVLAVQTNGSSSSSINNAKNHDVTSDGSYNKSMTPKCLVTGEGCDQINNPNLHSPSSRVAIEFNGPTRQGGALKQSCDVTLLDCSERMNRSGNEFYMTNKIYSQYNIDNDLQTFYREIMTFERRRENDNKEVVVGKIRVAAFLPYYMKEMDITNYNKKDGSTSIRDSYNENEAVAIYDYRFFMNRIDELEAASM